MFKSTIRILSLLAVVLLSGNSLVAQEQNTEDVITQWANIFSKANETAVFQNGKIVSLGQPIPNEGEKYFSFTHAQDGMSFTLTDENGINLQVFLYEDGRIQSVVMPNGESVVVNWTQTSSGTWVTENLSCNNNLMEAPGNPCRDALVATIIAIGICTASPGSGACWGATSNAAYHVFRCYEATHPRAILPNKMDNLKNYARLAEFPQNIQAAAN